MSVARSRSALDWFFNTPSAANFPQASVSPALSALCGDYSKFIDKCISRPPSFHDGQSVEWAAVIKRAVALSERFGDAFDSEVATNLTAILGELDSLLITSQNSEDSHNPLRSVLVSLIVYAKESTDFTFKKAVLDLVRKSEAQRHGVQNTSAS